MLARFLRRWDAWRNLAYDGPPKAADVREALSRRDVHCLVIRCGRPARDVGLFVLYGELGPRASIQFDIVVARPSERRRGIARQAILAFEEFMLGGGLCRELWAWIDANNLPCLELVRSAGWPIVSRHPLGGAFVDGLADIVVTRFDRRRWRRLRRPTAG